LLGLYDQKERLQYIGSVGIDTKQKQEIGNLRPKKTTTFYDRQPGEKSHWSGEAVGPWKPVAPTKVVEVRYDHFSDSRFRHGCTFLRVRPDKLAKGCLLEQVFQNTSRSRMPSSMLGLRLPDTNQNDRQQGRRIKLFLLRPG
jgi:ATP-dependent DNA ligase